MPSQCSIASTVVAFSVSGSRGPWSTRVHVRHDGDPDLDCQVAGVGGLAGPCSLSATRHGVSSGGRGTPK
jgi:hypothetical protein